MTDPALAPPSRFAHTLYGLRVLAMRPFMRAWGRATDERHRILARATDAPVARGGGPDPDRILLVGNDFGVSAAVRTHDLALTGQVARTLAAATGRGTDVEARTGPAVTMETMHGLLHDVRLWRYDAIVILSGVADAARLTPERRWRRSLTALLDDVLERSSVSTQILVMGTQPLRSVGSFTGRPAAIADRHAIVLNAATESVCESRPRVLYRRLPAPSGPPGRLGSRGALIFNEWADSIATALAPRLSAGPPTQGSARSRRSQAEPEDERQRAVDAMGLLPGTANERLNRITELARNLYRTSLATITVLDHDRQVHYSKVGMDREELPRADSVCDHTIRSDGASVYGDLWQDEHFKHIEALRDDPPIRFYAGYPIESPDGYRIGSLCVMDGEPRDASQVDPAPLRDLAMLVQKQLWADRQD
ncbi:hypothetical protein [uncultured Amnibacterium sp.]|uniref:hypothetical protein n=1 Tax=uncultured Amnibacterium sp. TaxID=1631851 RepID=UPI0035CA9671